MACGSDASGDASWMASFGETTSLASITLPGTHDSAAIHEPIPGIAKTQTLTFEEQLAAGVRYFDVRCRNYEDTFTLYHGSVDEDQTFEATTAVMYAFLAAHPSETLIVSIKEELEGYRITMPFDQVMANYIAAKPERWYTGEALPVLGEVRGKIVLLRRFDTTLAPLGIPAAPGVWTDNATFTIVGTGTGTANLRVEDNYVVTDDADKWSRITSLFGEAHAANDPSTLYLAYTSGYQMISGLPNITSVSGTIDPMLDTYFATATGFYGVVVMDFATAARAHAVLTAN
ncbi:phosphatidylinositol-specific phospholipase C [soil metagenome]